MTLLALLCASAHFKSAGAVRAGLPSGYTWNSPDIWTVPAVLNQNATVDLHIRVNNSTGATVNNVTVDAYYTDPRITLEFPSLTSVPIGTTIVSVPAGGVEVIIPWRTPTGTNIWGERHWCVGVVVKHENDMPLTTVVNRTSNVACHNFNTTTIVESGLLWVAATNFLSVAAELDLSVVKSDLPKDWTFELPDIGQMQKELHPPRLPSLHHIHSGCCRYQSPY